MLKILHSSKLDSSSNSEIVDETLQLGTVEKKLQTCTAHDNEVSTVSTILLIFVIFVYKLFFFWLLFVSEDVKVNPDRCTNIHILVLPYT